MSLRQRAAANATLSCLFGCAGHGVAAPTVEANLRGVVPAPAAA